MSRQRSHCIIKKISNSDINNDEIDSDLIKITVGDKFSENKIVARKSLKNYTDNLTSIKTPSYSGIKKEFPTKISKVPFFYIAINFS